MPKNKQTAQICKSHRWQVPSGGDRIVLSTCLDCDTKQYQPIDGLRETLAQANKLNQNRGYPIIQIPERVNHREPLVSVQKEVPLAEKVTPVVKSPVKTVQVVTPSPVPIKRKQKYAGKGIRGNHRWTEAEQDLVRLYYDGTRASIDKLMNMVGCSRYGVKGQVAFLGLARRMKEPNWTEKELRYLEQHYQKQSVRVMAHALGRSMNAVKVKATRLHYSLRARDGWFSKMEVCEMLGLDHHQVQRWIDSGELKASYHTGRRPSQKGMSMWHVDAADLKALIISRCQDLQGRNIDIFCILDLFGVLPEKSAGKSQS
jgi:hypothetical protein